MTNKKVFFIVGPTAVGKSEIAFELAKKIGGEIISADSMQVYKGMDIGTAKPPLKLRKKIPHHLIDIVAPAASFSVFRFRKLALRAIREIYLKERIPIVAGGSGLYVRAILEGISDQPGADAAFRKELSQKASENGLGEIYQKLQTEDPETAAKIKSTDEKRIIRALEILHVSGKKPSEWYRKKTSLRDLGYEPVVIGINQDRPLLYQKIERRVDQMFRKGLLREVKKLMRKRLSKTAREAIGYRETLQALRQGDLQPASLKELQENIKKNTRHFAKRQITWFKREQGIQWFTREPSESSAGLCKRILAAEI